MIELIDVGKLMAKTAERRLIRTLNNWPMPLMERATTFGIKTRASRLVMRFKVP